MRVKRYSIFALFLCCFLFGSAQNSIRVSIQPNKTSYPEKDFFFAKVSDQRANKELIGHIYKSNRQTIHKAVMKNSLEKELYQFLWDLYPNLHSHTKMLLVVHEFEIGHVLDSKKDTGFVKLNLDFYKMKGDSVFLVSSYHKTLSEPAEDVFLTHSNRMKRAILRAVADMEAHLNNSGNASSGTVVVLEDSLTKARATSIQNIVAAKPLSRADSLELKNNYPSLFFFLLGGHFNPYMSTLVMGANVQALFRLPKFNRWLLGPNVNFEVIKFLDRSGLADNQSYQLRTSDVGIRAMRQIRNSLFFNINPHFLFGQETIEEYTGHYVNNGSGFYSVQYSSNETVNAFFGFQLDLGVYVMPPKKSGLFCGFDLAMRMTNSVVFDSDAGIKLNLGVKF